MLELDDAVKLAGDIFRANGVHSNTIIAYTDDKLIYCPLLAENEEEKMALLQHLKLLFLGAGVTGYIHVSEIWYTCIQVDKNIKSIDDIPDEDWVKPSESEHRKEGLMIMRVTGEPDETQAFVYEIIRNGDDVDLVADENMNARYADAQIQGLMTELLLPKNMRTEAFKLPAIQSVAIQCQEMLERDGTSFTSDMTDEQREDIVRQFTQPTASNAVN